MVKVKPKQQTKYTAGTSVESTEISYEDKVNEKERTGLNIIDINDRTFLFRQLGYCFGLIKFHFLRSLELDDSTEDKNTEEEEVISDPVYELEQLKNMCQIPFYLEKFMIFTLLASLDGLLYYFTVLPTKIIQRLCLYGIAATRHDKNNTKYSQTYKERCILCLIMISTVVLSNLDTSKSYHRIKRQNTMKLYMLFNVLEMCDKMLASVGQSLLNVLLSPQSTRNYRNDRRKQLIMVSLSSLYLIAHGYILIYQCISLNVAVNSYNNALLALLLSLQFAEIKGSVFKKIDKEGLFQLTISDVVQRFKIFLLLLIIIIRNTGTMTNPDILSISRLVSMISNGNNFKVLCQNIMKVVWSPLVTVFSSEIIIDWVKHAYITKFNRFKPQIYDKFYLIMYKDHKTSLSQYQERLGLPLPAFVVLFNVMVRPVVSLLVKDFMPLTTWCPLPFARLIQALWMINVSFMILLTLRVIVHTILSQWGGFLLYHGRNDSLHDLTTKVTDNDYVPGEIVDGRGAMNPETRKMIYTEDMDDSKPKDVKIPSSIVEKRQKHDKKSSDSLERVSRYQMVSKRIW